MDKQYHIVSGNRLLRRDCGIEFLEKDLHNLVNTETKTLLVDVDDTLRSTRMRKHLLPNHAKIEMCKDKPNRAFEAFNGAAYNDPPIQPVIDMVKQLSLTGDYNVVLLTSCTYTEENLGILQHQLQHWKLPYDLLVMRGEENHLQPAVMKAQFIKDSGLDLIHNAVNTVAIDDNIANCQVFRNAGITTFQYYL